VKVNNLAVSLNVLCTLRTIPVFMWCFQCPLDYVSHHATTCYLLHVEQIIAFVYLDGYGWRLLYSGQ